MAFTGSRCIATSTCIHSTRTPPLSKCFLVGRFTTGKSSSHLYCSSTWQSLRALCVDMAASNTPKGDHSTPTSSKRRSPQLVDMEYAELNLKENVGEFGGVRTRQHVNPLKASLMAPVEPPNWEDVFEDTRLPLMVDIGSGSGRFLILLAKRFPGSKNFLGLEIRDKLVERSQFWAKELTLSNIHFMVANATFTFGTLVSTYPGPLTCVSILCPDPHFKKRHHKRRILQEPLVDAIISNLACGGQIFVQSDVHEVAVDMRQHLDGRFDSIQHMDVHHPNLCDDDGWLIENPIGIRTEREIHAQSEGAKIYRRMYEKI